MKPFYTASDFHAHGDDLEPGDAAELANAKLSREGRVMIGFKNSDEWYEVIYHELKTKEF